MTTHRLDEFVGGWIVGHFDPTLIKHDDVEVAIKHYEAGAKEKRHHHKIATEFTAIASGRVRMNGQEYSSGEIIQINPGVSTDFETLEPTITVVIKTPSVAGDKYADQA
ncbi:MAG: hypothetical protein AAF802_28350 [Planctomycetota bacterium]